MSFLQVNCGKKKKNQMTEILTTEMKKKTKSND